MEKLNKTFVHGQVLHTEEMQAIVDKIDELIEGGVSAQEVELSETEWSILTSDDTDYSALREGYKYIIYEDGVEVTLSGNTVSVSSGVTLSGNTVTTTGIEYSDNMVS